MSHVKKLGIWMYQSSVQLVEFAGECIEAQIPPPEAASETGYEAYSVPCIDSDSEVPIDLFDKLMKIIGHYKEVIIFGPADPKIALMNLLKSDHRFDDVKVELMHTGELNEHQLNLFVENHFSGNI